MSEATTISAMLKAVADGPAWHGPAVMDLLKDVGAEQAAKRPPGGAHSIWELVLHMNAWQDYVLRVLDGGDAAPLQGKEDWPAVPAKPTEDAWQTAQRQFEGGTRELRERIVHLDDKQLHEAVAGREFPLKVVLHGVVHHNLYHCGQIALLKRT